MPLLYELKGEKIVLHLQNKLLEAKNPVILSRLVDIEPFGIWIEGTDFAEFVQAKFKQPLEKTPVFFVPFAQIVWIIGFEDYPYLSEQSLGVGKT